MTTYNVRAVRWEHGWELHIDDVGVTQSHGLNDAERMVRDYLRLDYGDEVAREAEIVIKPDVDDLTEEVNAVRRTSVELRKAQDAFAGVQRAVVGQLKDRGLTGADIARVMEISPQRVSQLLETARTPGRAVRAKATVKKAAPRKRAAASKAAPRREGNVVDLLEALRATVDAASKAAAKGARRADARKERQASGR